MDNIKKRGVILMNLGSPNSTNIKDVRRYLMEFLMDKRVIDYPYLFRKLLVGGIIVPFRTANSSEAYKSVWTKDGSPLIVISEQLKVALQNEIQEPVEIAMRYGNPSLTSAFRAIMNKLPGVEEIIAIPMYPHYAMSSYETAVEHAKEVHRLHKYPFKLTFLKPYYKQEEYLAALCDSVRPYLDKPYDQLLFSYHGIPRRHILKGDVTGSHCLQEPGCCHSSSPAHDRCYRHQCIATTELVASRLKIPRNKFNYSFQSRLGREEWLKPYTAIRLSELPSEGIRRLLVVCPAFVSDCLETLQEMAIEGKHTFMQAGGESFTLIPCMNTHPLWVQALKKWVSEYAGSNETMILQEKPEDVYIH